VATPPEQPAVASAAAGIFSFGRSLPDDAAAVIGSPLKKARPSLGGDAGADITAATAAAAAVAGATLPSGSFPGSFPSALGDVLAKAQAAQASKDKKGSAEEVVKMEEEEL
jgi:hypothetical protein